MAPLIEQNCDMILVLSSELVCQLAEGYFNQKMLKQKVSVIELQARPDGLIQFMLAFKQSEPKPLPPVPVSAPLLPRAVNGRFRRKGEPVHATETP